MARRKTIITSISSFLRDREFSRAVAIVFAVVLPIGLAYLFDELAIGIGMAVGVFLCSPNDIAGSLKRRVIGISISILIAVFTSLLVRAAAGELSIFLPVMISLVFLYSLISVYGFRASLISFSGLLAVVLSMVKLPEGSTLLLHSLWIGVGGIWYLFLSLSLHFLNPRRQSEKLLAETFDLTATYLRLRADLLGTFPERRKELELELSELQTELNTNHETVREMLISRRKNSGRSSDIRKKLLVFMELVDILELGMANPVNHQQLGELFSPEDPVLIKFRQWTELMALELERISEHLMTQKKIRILPELEQLSEELKEKLARAAAGEPEKSLILQGIYHFKKKQQQKILTIERLLAELEVGEKMLLRKKDAVRFIPAQELDLRTLWANLDLKSPILRHSLRLSLVVLLGFGLGRLLDLQNVYWILLTSMVIMRPSYGLTKTRSKERTLGTLIGGSFAACIVYFVQSPLVYAVLAMVAFVIALATLQKNYRTSAAFITVNVIFVYALAVPNAFQVIEYRILDTLIGAGLAFLGNSFLWPTWEFRNIRTEIAKSLAANITYLLKVQEVYVKGSVQPSAYKFSRKEAFLALGDLSAAFQRMTQDPKSKQKDLGSIYRVVSLNQELLTSIASLGSFFRTHPITEASVHFRNLVTAIHANLQGALDILEGRTPSLEPSMEEVEEARQYFKKIVKQLSAQQSREISEGGEGAETGKKAREAQLVMDQLKWLLEISEGFRKAVLKLYRDSPT